MYAHQLVHWLVPPPVQLRQLVAQLAQVPGPETYWPTGPVDVARQGTKGVEKTGNTGREDGTSGKEMHPTQQTTAVIRA